MHFDGTLILLYFIEMLPHMVSYISLDIKGYNARAKDKVLRAVAVS